MRPRNLVSGFSYQPAQQPVLLNLAVNIFVPNARILPTSYLNAFKIMIDLTVGA